MIYLIAEGKNNNSFKSKIKSILMKSQADVFINRELSWIEFNKRVLLTGMEKEYKILDKVKFCSIFSNNLDEFFMVR